MVNEDYGPAEKVVFLCRECGADQMVITGAMTSPWPYEHLDVFLQCTLCGHRQTHGISFRNDGFETFIFDVNPEDALAKIENYILSEQFDPECCGDMTLTKIFGNQTGRTEGNYRIQFKCHKCYRVHHFDITLPGVKPINPKADINNPLKIPAY